MKKQYNSPGTILKIINWIFSLFFVFIALYLMGFGAYLQFILIFAFSLILLPPFRSFLTKTVNRKITWRFYLPIVILLWAAVILSFALNPAKSIYKSDECKNKIKSLYDEKLAEWPVPYKEMFIDTGYGKIHIIESGPEKAKPVLLINASGLSGWSWIFNVKDLSRYYRTIAIDNIGEGGKNEMIAPGKIPESGPGIAEYYADLCDKMGIKKSYVIGASIGGFIGTNYALYKPERVEKLVLLGPMGYGTTITTLMAMILAQGFPIKPVQDITFKWAFGNSPRVEQGFGQWFRIYMKGVIPTPIVPSSLSPEELKKLQVPTLAYFGSRDGVIGNALKAAELARNIPNVKIEIVESGHVIGAEIPEIVNKGIIDFFRDSKP